MNMSNITVNEPSVAPKPRTRAAKHQKTNPRPTATIPDAGPGAIPVESSVYPEPLRGLVEHTLQRIDTVVRQGQAYNYWAFYQSQTGVPQDWAWKNEVRLVLRDRIKAKLTDPEYLRRTILGLVGAREGIFTPDMLTRTILAKTGELVFCEVIMGA